MSNVHRALGAGLIAEGAVDVLQHSLHRNQVVTEQPVR
jgi:hypothetical protein